MGWIDTELILVSLAAMLSPTTLSFSLFVLILGDRPLRTGLWFFLGAMSVTLVIGVVAAFVLEDVAASSNPSTPKTWVAIVDLVAALLIIGWVVVKLRQPPNQKRLDGMIAQMTKVASAPALAIIGAGATLANPGGFIPIALKSISELNPSTPQYVADWLFFAIASLLPLELALLSLLVAREPTQRRLDKVRGWLERHARTMAAVIVLLLAAALLRNGISGLTS
jgi:Sap, sulfolipid-1-addressing protein